MLHKRLLESELSSKRDSLRGFASDQAMQTKLFESILTEFISAGYQEASSRLKDSGDTGALPSIEMERNASLVSSLGFSWKNHEEARKWASEILEHRTTFAADGSQILVERETTLPIGAIQIGWFENPHDAATRHVRDVDLEIITPEELLSSDEGSSDPATRIGERRFHGEVERVREFLESGRGWRERNEKMPLAFFDGTLLISFSQPQTRLQKGFVEAMTDLVETSARCEVPLVGYVDRSLSHDLLNMLAAFSGVPGMPAGSLNDAVFLDRASRTMSSWGDRTLFFLSNRRGLSEFSDPDSPSSVGFCYLRTSRSGPPARLDIPGWIAGAGLLGEVIDVVRAECVIGVGYPYPLEAADATALISAHDRQIFLRALQEFSVREELSFSVSRKDSSKARRR